MEIWELLQEPGGIGMILAALITVYYGSIRSQMFSHEIKKSPEIAEVVQMVDMKTALGIPIVSSISLILMFYFLGSFYLIMLVLVSGFCIYGTYFTISPALRYLVAYMQKSTISIFGYKDIDISLFMGISIGICVVLAWLFTGHWILNNFLGFTLCISYMSILRIPNIKIAFLLLTGLFFYDIFWVFYSKPIFGKNVMAEVATKLDLPIKYIIPNWNNGGMSMLGLGDMVLPGILMAFTYRLDNGLRIRRYFPLCFIGYAFGLVVAFIFVMVYRVAQPALLYLVPCCLGPVLIVGYFTNQLGILWNGIPQTTSVLPVTTE